MIKNAFSLLELLIALAIFSLLIAMAYPSYHNYVRRTHRNQAKAYLLSTASFLENYYFSHQSYQDAPLPQPSTELQKNYHFHLTRPNNYHYSLTATPIRTQAKDACGTLTYQSNGERHAAKTGCW